MQGCCYTGQNSGASLTPAGAPASISGGQGGAGLNHWVPSTAVGWALGGRGGCAYPSQGGGGGGGGYWGGGGGKQPHSGAGGSSFYNTTSVQLISYGVGAAGAPSGSTTDAPDGSVYLACSACSIGYYLNAAFACVICSAGYYGSNTAQTVANCSGLVTCGFYSAAGATAATGTGQCAAGRYGIATSVRTASTCDGTCTAGFYCPAGSCSATQAICPPGSFCATGVVSPALCPGGHYCPAGTSSWAHLNCGTGNYCPAGSGIPTPCPYQVPPSGGWGALQVQGPAFLVETSQCLNHCFWNFTSGDGKLSKC